MRQVAATSSGCGSRASLNLGVRSVDVRADLVAACFMGSCTDGPSLGVRARLASPRLGKPGDPEGRDGLLRPPVRDPEQLADGHERGQRSSGAT